MQGMYIGLIFAFQTFGTTFWSMYCHIYNRTEPLQKDYDNLTYSTNPKLDFSGAETATKGLFLPNKLQ